MGLIILIVLLVVFGLVVGSSDADDRADADERFAREQQRLIDEGIKHRRRHK